MELLSLDDRPVSLIQYLYLHVKSTPDIGDH